MTLAPDPREAYDGPEETVEEMTVTTDNKWHNFRYRNEVPTKVLEENFAHLKDETDYFIHYRNNWYHLSDFSSFRQYLDGRWTGRVLGGKPWDGYAPDTFFSGVIIKLATWNCETQYMIGRYYA